MSTDDTSGNVLGANKIGWQQICRAALRAEYFYLVAEIRRVGGSVEDGRAVEEFCSDADRYFAGSADVRDFEAAVAEATTLDQL